MRKCFVFGTYADEIRDRCSEPGDFSGVGHALSCKRIIQMKEEYERHNGIKYDMVVLYRPDVLLWKDMDLASYDVSEGVFVNAHPNFGGHFHFVMSSSDAAQSRACTILPFAATPTELTIGSGDSSRDS